MSTRSARARGSKKKVSYVETYSDESDVAESGGSEEEEWNSKKKPPKKKKQRLGKKSKSDDDSDSSDSDGADGDSQDGNNDDEQETGVDFSQFLPFEIVAEIFSYLNPKELLGFDSLSRSFHAILSGPSSRSLWVKARKNLQIPDVDYRGVTERQLANLLFNRECELCGTGKVETPDLNLCRRFCFECREANWVKISEVAKLYPDFHPATAQAVATTRYTAKVTRYLTAQGYALYSDLRNVSEHLEQLDLLDASNQPLSEGEDEDDDGDEDTTQQRNSRLGRRTGRVKYVSDGPSNEEVAKKFKRANRIRTSWRVGRRHMADLLEDQVTSELSPRIRMYLESQKARRQEWEKIARTLRSVLANAEETLKVERKACETSSRRLINSRRSLIEKKLMKKGFKRANFADPVWTTNELVNAPRHLTDQEWRKIKRRVTKLAGQSTASILWSSAACAAAQTAAETKEKKDLHSATNRLARLEAWAEREGDEEDYSDEEEKKEEDEGDDGEGSVEGSVDWKKQILKKPKNIPQTIWQHVLPHLKAFDAADSLDAPSSGSSQSKRQKQKRRFPLSSQLSDSLGLLSSVERKNKTDYFADKYQKLVDAQSSRARQVRLPIFSRFLRLPTVQALYDGNPFFAAQTDDEQGKMKSDAVWAKKLDDILEDTEQYGVDTVLHAIETLLLATTDATEDILSRYDIVESLAQGHKKGKDKEEEESNAPLFDDTFFARPEHWLICGVCRSYFGSLDSVLAHQHESHNSPQSRSSYSLLNRFTDDRTPSFVPLELSREAASAVASLFELAEVDFDSATSIDEFEAAVEGRMIEWENQPRKLGSKAVVAEVWEEIVCRIHEAALDEAEEGRVLEARTLTLRGRSKSERRRARYGRL